MLTQFLSGLKRSPTEKSEGLSVGLDIGSSSGKMVELRRKGNGFELMNWAIEPIHNADEQSSVKTILAKLTVPNHSPVTAVFGKGTLNRYIEMPRMALPDLKKSFLLEADKYFPFPPDQIYIDCYILDSKGKDNKMSVLVVAAKKELIDKRIRLLNNLDLQVNCISLNSIAVANVLNVLGMEENSAETKEKLKTEDAGAIAVLDMGEMESNLSIVVNRLPRFTRDIFVGGREFTKNISNAMGINMQEAEKLKCSPGQQWLPVLQACDATISSLVSELRLSFDYFVTEKNFVISQLLITGGSSMLQGIDEIFSKSLEVPVRRWNPTELLELPPKMSTDEFNAHASQLGVAVGLALYS